MDRGLPEQEQFPDVIVEDSGEGAEILPWGHGNQRVCDLDHQSRTWSMQRRKHGG